MASPNFQPAVPIGVVDIEIQVLGCWSRREQQEYHKADNGQERDYCQQDFLSFVHKEYYLYVCLYFIQVLLDEPVVTDGVTEVFPNVEIPLQELACLHTIHVFGISAMFLVCVLQL